MDDGKRRRPLLLIPALLLALRPAAWAGGGNVAGRGSPAAGAVPVGVSGPGVQPIDLAPTTLSTSLDPAGGPILAAPALPAPAEPAALPAAPARALPTVAADVPPAAAVLPIPAAPADALAADAPRADRTRTEGGEQAETGAAVPPIASLQQSAPLKAVVGGDPQASAAGLGRLYEGAPTGPVQFLNEDGPMWTFRAPGAGDPAPRGPPAKDYGGRTPVHVMFGGGVNGPSPRLWIPQYAREAVQEISARGEIPGLELLVVDGSKGDLQDVGDNFLAQDISEHGPASLASATRAVLEWAERNNRVIVGANAILHPFVSFATALQELVRDSGHNPDIPVNPAAAVASAIKKSRTRQLVNQYAPAQRLPSMVVTTREEAAAAFREIAATRPGARAFMKLEESSGKVSMKGDIGSPERAAEAFDEVMKDMEYWNANPGAKKAFSVQGDGRVIIERQIEGDDEYDVELTLARSADGGIEGQGFVIGNATPVPGSKAEKNMSFPALLGPSLQRALVQAAVEAVLAVWRPFGLLPFGNFHVELKLEDAADPQLLEINPTRPLGGTFGVPLVLEWSGLNLVRAGVRAALGLPLDGPAGQPATVIELRKGIPDHSGELEALDIPEAPEGLQVILVKKPGDKIEGTNDGGRGGFDSSGFYVIVRGRTLQEDAIALALEFMSRVQVRIRTAAGVVTQAGDVYHSRTDQRRLPL